MKHPVRRSIRFSLRQALAAGLFSLLWLSGCSAQPNEQDLKRVREQFLQLRFQAALSSEYRGKSDRELFEMACTNNRVQCDPLLDMLKTSDPAFFAKLQEKPQK